MQCTDGMCACKNSGESCAITLDCCGALTCNDGTCG
jgi:hypothetical protein